MSVVTTKTVITQVKLSDLKAWFNDPTKKNKDFIDQYQLADGSPMTLNHLKALCLQANLDLATRPTKVKTVYAVALIDDTIVDDTKEDEVLPFGAPFNDFTLEEELVEETANV